MERAAAGRSTAMRARPKTSRSRSSSRGPQRPRSWRPNWRSRPLSVARRVEGAGRRIRAGRRVECHDRVPELGLVDDADRLRRVQARDGTNRGWTAAPKARGRPRRASPRHRRRWRRGRCTRGLGGRTRVPLRWRLDSEPCARSASESSTRDRSRTRDRWSAGWPRSAGRAPDATRRAFAAAGASDVAIVSAPPDATPFGARLRDIVSNGRGDGLVVLGSGAVPLATAADRRAFVAAAGADDRRALANNRYSADVVAISRVATLPVIPDLPGDNALPRWLEEVAGYRVDDLRRRWRLGFDIDSPLDIVLLRPRDEAPVDVRPVTARLAAIRAVAADPRAELLVAGRTSARHAGVARTAHRWPASGRGSRSAGCGPRRGWRSARRRHDPGAAAHRPASSGSSSTRPGPARLAPCSPGCAMRRSSTRGSCWPTASGPTRRPGPRPRIASPPTSCCPSGSSIRGSGR